jgi:hypothetical protein
MLNNIASILGVGAAVSASSFESIATTTVGASSVSSIDFNSISGTYKHLQLRILAKTDRALNRDGIVIRFNSDSGNSYTRHGLYGDGAATGAEGTSAATNNTIAYRASGNSSATNIFGAIIIDLLDYSNTNKYKTMRSLGGVDLNGSGEIDFYSGLWLSTSAITSINLAPAVGTNFLQYSSFALYGVKG